MKVSQHQVVELYQAYNVANALESSTFNGSWHGSHVAGTAAGNQFGAAFESNIWSIACIDRSDVGFSDPLMDLIISVSGIRTNQLIQKLVEKSHYCKW